MKTVIAGAVYKRENDLVIPHYTGEFWMVDCDNYVTMEELIILNTEESSIIMQNILPNMYRKIGICWQIVLVN